MSGAAPAKNGFYEALKLIIQLSPKGILINIYGGITRCDVVAEAIVQTIDEIPDSPPLAIRLSGTNEKEGFQILADHGIPAFHEAIDAIKTLKDVIE